MRNKTYSYYRRQRVQQEMRANQEGWERPKRRPHRLETWGELECPYVFTNCWKDKRHTQYRENTKGFAWYKMEYVLNGWLFRHQLISTIETKGFYYQWKCTRVNGKVVYFIYWYGTSLGYDIKPTTKKDFSG